MSNLTAKNDNKSRINTPRPSASTAPLSLSAQVVNPSTPSNVIGYSSGVVTRIPSVTYASSPFI